MIPVFMSLKQHRFLSFLLILIPTIVLLSLWIFRFDGNITGFFRIGSEFPHSPYLNLDQAFIFQGEIGHDGQQFLTIAFDPFLNNPDSISALDKPVYRYRRIFYPLLGFCFSFGQARLIPYMMVALNFVAILLLGYFVKQYFLLSNQSPWQSLFIFCIPSTWMSLVLSTSELIASILLVITLYGYRKGNIVVTSLGIALCCLTRETMLLIWISLFVATIWDKGKTLHPLPIFLAGLPSIAWGLYVSNRFGFESDSGVSTNFGYPLIGIFDKLKLFLTSSLEVKELYEFYSFILLLLAFIALLTFAIHSIYQQKVFFLAGLLLTSLLLCLSITVLGYYLDYNRVFMDIYILLLLIPVLSNNQRFKWLKISVFCSLFPASFSFLLLSS